MIRSVTIILLISNIIIIIIIWLTNKCIWIFLIILLFPWVYVVPRLTHSKLFKNSQAGGRRIQKLQGSTNQEKGLTDRTAISVDFKLGPKACETFRV